MKFLAVALTATLLSTPTTQVAKVSVEYDEGGGWSFDNRAYGSTMGSCAGKDVFSVADLYDEALGVFVPTV